MVGHACKYYFQKNFQIESPSIDAAAIFGSCARGDSDQLSDRDILLVSKDSKSLRLTATHLESMGWSCSVFTWSQFSRECRRKSLFVQHLKLESIVIKDTHDRLQDSLYYVEPRGNYSWEIEQAKELIGLIEYIPLIEWGSIWALDVLMVGFRSFGYAILANEGMFRFSFDEVLNGLCTIGLLKSSDLPLLRALRKWKRSYREGIGAPSSINRQALELICLIDERIKLGLHVNFIAPVDFTKKQGDRTDNSKNWYRNSRALEAIVRLHPRQFDNALLHRLCSPQGYSSVIRKLDNKAIVSEALAA